MRSCVAMMSAVLLSIGTAMLVTMGVDMFNKSVLAQVSNITTPEEILILLGQNGMPAAAPQIMPRHIRVGVAFATVAPSSSSERVPAERVCMHVVW